MSVSETPIAPGASHFPSGQERSEIAEISEMSQRADGHGVPHRFELPADRYLDREQSWVRFNQRVLELA